MAVNGRNKGANAEREAADYLKSLAREMDIDIDPTRNLEQSRGGGYDLNGVPGMGVEVKRQENLSIKAWWAQALRQAKADGVHPLLMWRQNRQPWRFRTIANVQVGNYLKQIVVDMEKDQFKIWFQYWLWHQSQL